MRPVRRIDRVLEFVHQFRHRTVGFAGNPPHAAPVARQARLYADRLEQRRHWHVMRMGDEGNTHPGTDGFGTAPDLAEAAVRTRGEKKNAGQRQQKCQGHCQRLPRASSHNSIYRFGGTIMGMADWERYRATYLRGNKQVLTLQRLRTLEAWLRLPEDEAREASHREFAGQTEEALRPWYQLSSVLRLKGVPNTDWVSGVLLQLYPRIGELSPDTLAGNDLRQKITPLQARLMNVPTALGLVTPQAIPALQEILGEFETLYRDAAPGNAAHADAMYYCGETAYALGDASANLGDNDQALEWYARSESCFRQAGDDVQAAQARQKGAALELAVTGDVDRAMQRILGTVFDSAHPADAVSVAMAYADLAPLLAQTGDAFGAGESASRAAAAFEKASFRDPEQGEVEAALDSCMEQACDRSSGSQVYELLMKVCNAFLALCAGRAARFAASDPARSERNRAVILAMNGLIMRIETETRAAERTVSEQLAPYFPQPPAPPPPTDDGAFARMQERVRILDEALSASRDEAERLAGEGKPLQPVFTRLQELGPEVQAIGAPLFAAKWKLAWAHTYLCAGEIQAAGQEADEARTALLCGRPSKLRSFSRPYERTLYLEARLQTMRASMMSGQLRDGLTTALQVVADFEESRYRVNSPLRQSAIVSQVVKFHTGAAFASFKLQDWDTWLQVTELVKARTAIRTRLSAEAPPIDRANLERQFRDITAALPVMNGPAAEELKARRRDIWDLLAIARAQAAGATPPPALSVAAVQNALAPDEAAIGYFFLDPSVLLIAMCDRRRFDVKRIILEGDKLEPVRELLDAIRQLDATGPLDLDDAIRAIGQVLVPPVVREFIEGKARVVISPHHALHLFPFHAASWDGKFLIERCAVRYVPNFSSLLLEWRGLQRAGAFTIGVSRFAVPGQTWPDLPNAEEQARSVAATYRARHLPADCLTGTDATVEAFRAHAVSGALGKYSALHMATHGTSVFASDARDEPMESRLVFQDGCIDGLELATCRIPADVVVLSACNSGQRATGGRGWSELPGDDIFGLQSALFQAGVHTVLGSLWPVETNAAYHVTSDFHSHYASGDTVDAALQKAILKLLASTGGAQSFKWAPFFLSSLGTPRVH